MIKKWESINKKPNQVLKKENKYGWKYLQYIWQKGIISHITYKKLIQKKKAHTSWQENMQ